MGDLRVDFSSTVLGGWNGGIVLAGSPAEAYAFISTMLRSTCR
jgi:hypothetical protein